MNDPKRRLKETDRVTIELSSMAAIKTILKGEPTTSPIGFIQWAAGVAKENGIILSIGHRGEVGAFISETLLRQCLKEIEEHGTDTDNS